MEHSQDNVAFYRGLSAIAAKKAESLNTVLTLCSRDGVPLPKLAESELRELARTTPHGMDELWRVFLCLGLVDFPSKALPILPMPNDWFVRLVFRFLDGIAGWFRRGVRR